MHYRTTKKIVLRPDLHEFFKQYAWEYPKVRIPEGSNFTMNVREAQKIGKAMVTQYEVISWEKSVNSYSSTAKQRSEDFQALLINMAHKTSITAYTKEIHDSIASVWNLQFMFLFGGSIKIMEVEAHHHNKILGKADLYTVVIDPDLTIIDRPRGEHGG